MYEQRAISGNCQLPIHFIFTECAVHFFLFSLLVPNIVINVYFTSVHMCILCISLSFQSSSPSSSSSVQTQNQSQSSLHIRITYDATVCVNNMLHWWMVTGQAMHCVCACAECGIGMRGDSVENVCVWPPTFEWSFRVARFSKRTTARRNNYKLWALHGPEVYG